MQIYLKNYDTCENVKFGAISWKFDILSITAKLKLKFKNSFAHVQGRIHVWSESAPAPLLTDKSCKFSLFYVIFWLFWGYIRSPGPPPFWISASPFYISWIRPCMCDTYDCDYLKHSTFCFNLIDFQLNTDFPSQFCVFYRKIT